MPDDYWYELRCKITDLRNQVDGVSDPACSAYETVLELMNDYEVMR